VRTLLSVVLGAAVAFAGNLLGLWWLALLVGAVLGVWANGWWAGAAGLAGWLADLAWVAMRGPVFVAARVSAAIAGLPRSDGILLLGLGAALAFAGAALAGALTHAVGRRAKLRQP
jgi:hypothetical protein